jgi:hypothetical protein
VGLFENYFSHAAIHPNHPAMVALNFGGDGRPELVSLFEENGLPIMYMSEPEVAKVLAAVPDTLGLNQEQIDNMPPFVRYFKCENSIETGEPGCGWFKFTPDHCGDRRFRTSWHPGWKWHGTFGNMITLSLTEMLEDALKYLLEKETYVADDLLDQLRSEEDEEYQKFFASNITEHGRTGILPEDQLDGLDMSLVLRTRPICHTCRLPAMSRYLGLTTETPPGDMLHYPMGFALEEAKLQADDNSKMKLVWDAGQRQVCEIPLNQDHKDYYLVTPQHYGTGEPYKGLVMVTMTGCYWGECTPGEIREDGYASGTLEMEINGVKVTSATVASESHFVRHGDRELFFPPNDQGRFEIRVKVNGAETEFARFSAFVIW